MSGAFVLLCLRAVVVPPKPPPRSILRGSLNIDLALFVLVHHIVLLMALALLLPLPLLMPLVVAAAVVDTYVRKLLLEITFSVFISLSSFASGTLCSAAFADAAFLVAAGNRYRT